MKQLLLCSFLIFTGLAQAQNYRTVVPSQEAWFAGPYDEVNAIKPDSVVSSGTDSLTWNYPVIRANYNTNRFDTMAPSWIGRYTVERSNGDEIFFNSNNDSIFFKTYLPVGGSWTFYRFPNGDYYEASISGISFITTPVFSDSAKTISLQLYDSSNQPIFGIFNSSSLLVSKSHGFVQLFDIYNFPNDNNPWQRIDAHRLTKGEIYNFNIGDQLQYIINDAQAVAPPSKIVRTVIAKTNWLPDSMQYVFYRELTTYTVVLQNIDTFYTAVNETLTVYKPDSLLFQEYPGQAVPHFPEISALQMSYYHVASCSSLSAENNTYWSFFDSTCQCYPLPFEEQLDLHRWVSGLGQVNGVADIPHNVAWQEVLVYYHIGTDSCGNSIITFAENSSATPVSISPNPACSSITISGENISGKFVIRDITGKIVKEIQSPGNASFLIDVSDLAPGVYFISSETARGSFTGKFLKQ